MERRIEQYIDNAAAGYREVLENQLLGHSDLLESPIEELLFASFFDRLLIGQDGDLSYEREIDEVLTVPLRRRWALFMQVKAGAFQMDFLVRSASKSIAVECDGHAFHDRTPEQAERDKSRDRALAERGLVVIRFTGREIWRDPVGCVEQALRVAGCGGVY